MCTYDLEAVIAARHRIIALEGRFLGQPNKRGDTLYLDEAYQCKVNISRTLKTPYLYDLMSILKIWRNVFMRKF